MARITVQTFLQRALWYDVSRWFSCWVRLASVGTHVRRMMEARSMCTMCAHVHAYLLYSAVIHDSVTDDTCGRHPLQ
jgi:hypothetical protein